MSLTVSALVSEPLSSGTLQELLSLEMMLSQFRSVVPRQVTAGVTVSHWAYNNRGKRGLVSVSHLLLPMPKAYKTWKTATF